MKNNLECPECYGKPPKKPESKCTSCEYAESCALYASMREEPVHARSHTVNDKALEIENNAARTADDRGSRTTVTVRELADFVKFLFRIDDYTLLILREVFTNGATTLAEIAKTMGVRRQSIHAKILNAVRKFPELGDLFGALMPRLSVARRRFLHSQTRKFASKNKLRKGN